MEYIKELIYQIKLYASVDHPEYIKSQDDDLKK